MKRQNNRVRLNGGSKTALPQAPTNPEPASAEQGIHSDQTTPAGLKINHLALLKVLAANQTKFGLAADTIAVLIGDFGISDMGKDDSQLHLLSVMGWATEDGCDHWRITSAGREVLRRVDDQPASSAKGFIQVNLAQREQDELREMAKSMGMSLRHALDYAVLCLKVRLRESLKLAERSGLKPLECFQIGQGYNNGRN